ncbi:hypothetical protein B1A87_006155 [Arthrobacter sp. KBS0703]|nr:hypothetical protein B1A87_006155 [Arthrobacter sp. KBS0703]
MCIRDRCRPGRRPRGSRGRRFGGGLSLNRCSLSGGSFSGRFNGVSFRRGLLFNRCGLLSCSLRRFRGAGLGGGYLSRLSLRLCLLYTSRCV